MKKVIMVQVLLLATACGKKSSDNQSTDATPGNNDSTLRNGPDAQLAGTASQLPSCDSNHNGALYYVISESKFYSCLNSQNVPVSVPSGNQGPTGATGPQGGQGPGLGYLNISGITATAVGTAGTAWIGTTPGNMSNMTDAADAGMSISAASTTTTTGSITATAGASGCFALDLGAFYTGNAYAKIMVFGAAAVTPTIRWEYSSDNTNWYFSNSSTPTLTTSASIFYPATSFAGRYIKICLVEPATGMQIINIIGFQMAVNSF